MNIKQLKKSFVLTLLALFAVFMSAMFFLSQISYAATESGSVGMTGTISAPPPTKGATITFPNNNQTFNTLPVTVTGICPKDLLVKIFKNNVFAGSVECTNGSYSIKIDLFTGTNDLVARVYDSLDQPGPDSNTVRVTFSDPNKQGAGSRVSVTSNYAKRGAFPKETLTWPIIISGGNGPYAVSVDWGDGKDADISSQPFPGAFDIKHVYDSAGVYNIVVKVVDKDGVVAFLQLVGIGNGPLSQTGTNNSNTPASQPGASDVKTKIVWQPAVAIFPFVISTFWLGKKYELHMLRKKISRGERPFAD
jgi:hypothetical protein